MRAPGRYARLHPGCRRRRTGSRTGCPSGSTAPTMAACSGRTLASSLYSGTTIDSCGSGCIQDLLGVSAGLPGASVAGCRARTIPAKPEVHPRSGGCAGLTNRPQAQHVLQLAAARDEPARAGITHPRWSAPAITQFEPLRCSRVSALNRETLVAPLKSLLRSPGLWSAAAFTAGGVGFAAGNILLARVLPRMSTGASRCSSRSSSSA